MNIESDNIKSMLDEMDLPVAVYKFENYKVTAVAVSKGFMNLFGEDTYEKTIALMNDNMYRDTHPDDIARVADAAYQFAMKGGVYDAVYRSKTRTDKNYHIIHSTGQHVYLKNHERIAIVSYIDENNALEDDNSYTASQLLQSLEDDAEVETRIRRTSYDDLTGIPNMMYFLQTAGAERQLMRRKNKQPVILFLDLNGLKFYNHQYGLGQGDLLIRSFAGFIREIFGSENAGRFGADHFAILTEQNLYQDQLNELFQKMKTACSGRTLTFRAGVYPDAFANVSISTACDRAKLACDSIRNIYQAQYAVFNQKMLDESNRKEYILSHLDEALEKGWIIDYYQPIVRTGTYCVCDEEALARWKDPEKGMLRPDAFIPILEDAGVLYKLDLYMVDRIIAYIARKKKLGIPIVPVSVNLSEHDFMACDMVKEISERLDGAGIPREYLTIEITERSIGRNPELLSGAIERFHKEGFKIWLDDFGSEYSSLNVLQDYRFELIKLDMKFLKRFKTSRMSRLIINEVLDLAKKADVETVTEGVETTEQVAFLSEAGCVKLQGFLYSRPLPEDELLTMYEKGNLVLETDAKRKSAAA